MTKEEAEKSVEEAFQAYDMHEWERERWLEKYPELGERMWDEKHARLKTALIEAVRKAERERAEKLRSAAALSLFTVMMSGDDGVVWCGDCWSKWDEPHDDDCGAGALQAAIATFERACSSEEAGNGG